MNSPSRRDVLKGIGGAGALALGGVGAASAAGRGRRQGASAENDLVQIAEGAGLSILVDAATRANLAGTLSGNRQLTVFAPTNSAFENLLANTPYESLDDIPLKILRNILLYHVTSGRRYAASVVNAPQIKMLNGGTVRVNGTRLNGGGLGGANITETNNVEASNGVAHVIDGVLLPPSVLEML